MESRGWIIAAGAAAALGVLALSAYVPEEPATRPTTAALQRESHPDGIEVKDADETLVALLPSFEKDDETATRAAVEQVQSAIAGDGAQELSRETKDKMSAALLQAYARTKEDTSESKQLKASIVSVLIGQIGGDRMKDFTVDLLTTGSDEMKVAALSALAMPNAVKHSKINEAALALVKTPVVPDVMKPGVLRRALGKKAEPELLAFIQRVDASTSAVRACAVELQNLHKPQLMGVVLKQLDAKGLIAQSDRMPWISGRLLAQFVRIADKDELTLALGVIKNRPGLTKHAMPALKERLRDSNASVRRMVAGLIPQAVSKDGIDPESGEEVLVARLKEENDPAVKGTIEEGLAQVRLTRQPQDGTKTDIQAPR